MSVKFNHKEAFCMMTYECEDCERKVNIWNSRDGVTPFMVKCRYCKSGAMKHINWEDDVIMPYYHVKLGDFVFVTQTQEEYVEEQKERAKKIWWSDKDCRDNYDSLEQFQECLSSSGYHEGQPLLRLVGIVPWKPSYSNESTS